MNCKNCGQIVDGNFCSHCGQNSKVGKINLSNLGEEISSSVFQIDKGIFYTFKELLVRPGDSIKEFLSGKRKNYIKPVAYVFTFSTLYFLVSRLVGGSTVLNEFITGFSMATSHPESDIEIPSFLAWLAENFAYSTLILLPIFSFASYISFLGLGRNYLEHIVLNSYIIGQQAIFYSVFILLQAFISSEFLELIPVVISVFYAFWVFWQFFTEGKRTIIILRSVITYFFYLVFIFVLLFTFIAITEFG